MAGREAMMSVACCVTVLALLSVFMADGRVVARPEKLLSRLPREEREVKQQQEQQQQPQPQQQQQQLHTSAINTALAFELYRDLATRTTAERDVQQQHHQQQHNILFSPVGLASALALLSQVSGSDSRSQALEALGLAANSTEQSVKSTISALTDLQRSLALQGGRRGGGGGGAGAAAGAETERASAANRTDEGAAGRTGSEDGLRVWSSLHVEGKPTLDYDGFVSRPPPAGPSTSNTSFEALTKDLRASDKLVLDSYVYFKGRQPFERRHTAPRSFRLNATASADVAMMFRDDSSEVMMLYDTNCSATVVRLGFSKRLASLLLLPKAELQPLESCLSDSRMSFWLSNLKPGRAEIRFPKFQLRKSYSLERLLRNAGVSSVFTDLADFSGISSKKKLKLVKAPHVVTLEVEETKSEVGRRPDVMLDFSVPQRITFDRPFMLIIYDELTGLVLIMGRISDPTDV